MRRFLGVSLPGGCMPGYSIKKRKPKNQEKAVESSKNLSSKAGISDFSGIPAFYDSNLRFGVL